MKTILIVEDNELNMKLFDDLLQAYGYKTLKYPDGMDVMQLAREHCPDLIIMDIQLPEVSGFEHTKMLKADDDLKDIPVIAVTASASHGDKRKMLEAGFDDFLSKPISPTLFLETVSRFVPKARFRLSESLMTGHAVIDAEHEQLVVLINEFADFQEAKDEKACAGKIKELTETLKSHLDNERRIMEELGCWHLKEHKIEQVERIGKYDTLVKDAALHGYGGNFTTELTSIFFDDFINAEMVFKSHLQKIDYRE
jgi:two-component system cell cycle response regulator DivK